MKQFATFLLLIATGSGSIAQDSLKTADTSQKFNQQLAEVTITAKRPLMIQSVDKTIVDVKPIVSGAALNTIELLERIPGITVSANGDISLNGRTGVLVLIEGRSTYMSSQDLASYLKSIPAANLDKIELIDNPSSRYDASGNAIINIKMRRNRNAGLTGSINSGISQGKFFRSNNSVNLNFSRKKLNVFSNFGFSTAKEYSKDVYDRKYYGDLNNITSSILLQNYNLGTNKNINIYSGFDYMISPKSTIGGSFGYNKGERNVDFDYLSRYYINGSQPSDKGTGTTDTYDERNNISVNLNFVHQYNKDGRELSADFNYLEHSSGSNRLLENMLYDNNNSLIEEEMFRYIVPVSSRIFVLKADYVHPYKNKMRLEAGVKSSVINNDNVSDYFDLNGTSPIFVPGNSNHFKYDENINAAYVNLQKAWQRWQAQFGLRLENMQSTGNQLGNSVVQKTEFKKSNTELFPSAFVLYKLDSMGSNSLSLLTVRRINRPNYFQLNPFMFLKDQYTFTSGNSDLNPQFQYRVEMKYQHKQLYWFGLSYNRFTQVIFNITDVADEKYINRPDNVGKGFMLLLNTGLTISPARWWNMNNVLRISRMGLRGNERHAELRPDAFVVRLEAMNFFTVSKTVNAELGGYYASKDMNGQAFTKQMFWANVAMQKKIWNEKGSIRLGVDDIFHSWKYRNRSVGLKQAAYFQTTEMDTQRFAVAFSYRFGKDNNSRKRRQSNANDEERGRLE